MKNKPKSKKSLLPFKIGQLVHWNDKFLEEYDLGEEDSGDYFYIFLGEKEDEFVFYSQKIGNFFTLPTSNHNVTDITEYFVVSK